MRGQLPPGGGSKIGEPFNPWRGALGGFYVPDAVGRLSNLGDGPKRVYERLVRYAGRDGVCYPAQATLAADLGLKERTVRHHVATLVKRGFLRPQRTGRSSNRYEFLWHECFDRQPIAGRDSYSTGNPLPDETDEPMFDRQDLTVRPAKTCTSTGNPLPLNSVHEFSTKNSSSSSSKFCTEGEATTTTRAESRNQDAEPEPDIEEARHALAKHYHRGLGGPLPDPLLVRDILEAVGGADFDRWLADLHGRVDPRSVKRWGFYLADARQWPRRRALLPEPPPEGAETLDPRQWMDPLEAWANEPEPPAPAPAPKPEPIPIRSESEPPTCKCGGAAGWWVTDDYRAILCTCAAGGSESARNEVNRLNGNAAALIAGSVAR